ncbi:conserved hypothetical protein [Dehalogenimonas lykanthroporepellens BL-DC-9]|nr:conserved hypothetical protein [Dehalogenimonas lykanthroporepellens BL-DC-9]
MTAFTPFPYQTEIYEAVIDSIFKNRGLTFSVEIARQGGKNELSALLEASLLFYYQQKSYNIIKCAPTFNPQALISLRRLCGRLSNWTLNDVSSVERGYVVRLGEARAFFLSAAPRSNVVGNTAHLLLEVDEAQDVTVEKFDRDFRPMAAVANATTVLYGTPWRQGSLLDEVKSANLRLEADDGLRRHFRYDWRVVAGYRPLYRKFVEGEMARLGENHPTFRTQYALLPLEAGDGLFTDTHLMAMSGEYPRLRLPRPGDNYVGGLDLGGDAGAGADSSVLTVAAVTPEPGGEPRLRVVNHFAWTGLPGGALIPRVLEVVRAWKLRRLAVDATGLGQPLAGMLRRSLGSRIVSFVFTRKTKSELGYQLLASVGTGRLELYARDSSPESVECWRQLETAEAEYRADRTMNFFVNPATGHDDYLISLALVLKAAECYRPRTASGVR